MGVRHSLFPVPTFGAPFTGLPASRRHSPRQAEFTRPHSRAVQRLAATEFRVRPLSSLRLMVAPPAYEPGQDTFMIYVRVLTVCAGTAIAFADALAQCYGSDLLTLELLFAHMPAVSFLTSPLSGSFSRVLPRLRVLPGSNAHFVPPFGVFRLADPCFWQARQSHPSRADAQ